MCIAVATTEADEAIASSDFLKIMGISPQKEPTGVILVSFDHFALSDFNVWLRSCSDSYCSLKPLWEGMGDVGSARYEPSLLPPCLTRKRFKLLHTV